MQRSKLSEQDKAVVRARYMDLPARKIGLLLGVSKSVVAHYLRQEGLKVPAALAEQWRRECWLEVKKMPIAPSVQEYISQHYMRESQQAMAKAIGRSRTYVKAVMRELGLEVPEDVTQARKEAGLFKPGMAPANKGKRMEEFMAPEQLAVWRANQFQKGNLPWCSLGVKDGDIRVRRDMRGRNYQWVRMSLGNWQPLHRVVWEQANGAIPRAHAVVFKDGDSMNCALDNLELMSLADNMRRNSFYKVLPEDLRQTIRTLTKLKKVIYEKQNRGSEESSV